LETLWYCLVAAMLTLYVVFDGFDIGAGIIHLYAARTDRERREVLRSIGPVWDGNEVWLLAAGGTLYFAFPALYAASFSGFYLPLMIVLWLLMLRGISIEFRSHIDSPVWKPVWDAAFCASSALLAVFFGAALGSVVRGVPLDAAGHFFEPLWTDFRLGPESGILDWYTLLVGLAAFFTLAEHGALWVTLKTTGALQKRARWVSLTAWWGVASLTGIITFFTFRIQPQVLARLAAHPWGYVFPALALAGLFAMRWFSFGRDAELRAFLASCAFIAGMLASAAFGIYPYVLPASTDPARALTVHNAAASAYGLKVGLAWWIPGMILAGGYFAYVYRHFRGKVRLQDEGY
jgi:cytochrome d ubiquinol oxidase subunit II